MNINQSIPNKVSIVLVLLTMALPLCFVNAQTDQQLLHISSSYEKGTLTKVKSSLENAYRLDREKVNAFALQHNLKIKDTLANGSKVELQSIDETGIPLYYETYTNEAGKTSRASTLNSNGLLGLDLNGEGMKVGVWDSGVAMSNHIEYTSRLQSGDAATLIDAHATRVTGSIISTGINSDARGVASKATVVSHDWTRDKVEVTNAAANGLLLSNHSYGIKADRVPDWYFGAYTKAAQDWDKIMFNAPYYLMVTAAGNSQKSMNNAEPIDGNSADGYDVLLGFTLTKNGITVAGSNATIDDNGNLKDAQVSAYSSFGPVDDGRIKPDLAGNGSMILSTDSKSSSSYETSAGTSMAAPGVTGSLLLLQQYNEQLYGSYLKAATLKGLALHTADDVDEQGPDYRMGWGIMNTKKASEVLFNKEYNTHVSEETLTNGESFSITFNAADNADIKASISWTDPESEFINRGELNNTTAALVNDLDIRITKDGETFFPWKLDASQVTAPAIKGDNKVDPFEQIEIPNAEGTYTITVTHKGNLTNILQDFSLIVSGIHYGNCAVGAPENIKLKIADETSVALNWDEIVEGLFEVQYKSENELEWTTEYVSENEIEFLNLTNDLDYTFRMRTFCTSNVASSYSDEFKFTFAGKATVLQVLDASSTGKEIPFNVYPNPAVDVIHLNMEASDTAMYSIVSTTGVVLKSAEAKDAKINVSDLPNGLYIVQVQDKGVNRSTKFYKY